jgi:hypothetical protein
MADRGKIRKRYLTTHWHHTANGITIALNSQPKYITAIALLIANRLSGQ